MLLETLIALSVGFLGVFLGAQITEGVLFVPYWKALSPSDFFNLHQTYGKKIYRFFAPLTIISTLVPLFTLTYGIITNTRNLFFLALMVFFTALFFSTYYIYFKKANKQFADASIPYDQLPAELTRWGNWHWTRIAFECLAFICSIISLMQL